MIVTSNYSKPDDLMFASSELNTLQPTNGFGQTLSRAEPRQYMMINVNKPQNMTATNNMD